MRAIASIRIVLGESNAWEWAAVPSTAHAVMDSELFAGLSPEQAQRLDRLAKKVRFKKGAVLFSAGEAAEDLYVVLEGAVELRMPVPGWWGIDTPHQKMTTARPGQIVGWSALAEPCMYSLTAVASERCLAARFEASALRDLMSADPEMGNRVRARALSVVSRRLDTMAEAVLAQRAVMASQAASRADAPAYA